MSRLISQTAVKKTRHWGRKNTYISRVGVFLYWWPTKPIKMSSQTRPDPPKLGLQGHPPIVLQRNPVQNHIGRTGGKGWKNHVFESPDFAKSLIWPDFDPNSLSFRDFFHSQDLENCYQIRISDSIWWHRNFRSWHLNPLDPSNVSNIERGRALRRESCRHLIMFWRSKKTSGTYSQGIWPRDEAYPVFMLNGRGMKHTRFLC